jgi:hypothetical protein
VSGSVRRLPYLARQPDLHVPRQVKRRPREALQVAACRDPGSLSHEHPHADRRALPAHPHLPPAHLLRRVDDLSLPALHTCPCGAGRQRGTPGEGQPAQATPGTPGTRGGLTLFRSARTTLTVRDHRCGPRLGTAPAALTLGAHADAHTAHARPDRCEANLQGVSPTHPVDAPSPRHTRAVGEGCRPATNPDIRRAALPSGVSPLEHRSTRQNPGRGSYGAHTPVDLARCSNAAGG